MFWLALPWRRWGVAIGLWSACNWRRPWVHLFLYGHFPAGGPQLPKRHSGTRSLLHFGAHLTASSFLWSIARGSDGLLIGRVYGSAPLGLYSRAGALLARPLEQFMPPIEAVLVPTLSRMQSQPERYRRVVLRAYEVIAVAGFFLAGLLLALAHPLTLVVLGPKWEKAAPIFAAFTLVALFTPIGSVATWLLTSQGRGRDFLTLSSITSPLTVVFYLVGLPFGPVGVAMSYSAVCLLVALPLTYYIAGRRGPVTTRDLWIRFFTHLPVWGVVCGATWLTHSWAMNMAPLTQLLICAPVGFFAGVVFVSVYGPSRRAVLSLGDALRGWKQSCQESLL